MNWLAHLLLAADARPLRMVGNLAGDFVRGVDIATLDPELRRGIEDHRAVDRFTDAHDAVLLARTRLTPALGRYAEVALDLWFDHLVARSWSRWRAHEPLPAFEARVASALDAHRERLPTALAEFGPRLVGDGLLGSYVETSGIERALRGVSRRARRQPNPLAQAAAAMREESAALERAFDAFFPDLVAFASERIGPARR
jgi:acyl carrier protein phosphodiesterase